MSEQDLTPVEYAVFGVLCAAKRQTGPGGARRFGRIQMRMGNFDDEKVYAALQHLHELGWIRQCEEIFPGMVHFEVTPFEFELEVPRDRADAHAG